MEHLSSHSDVALATQHGQLDDWIDNVRAAVDCQTRLDQAHHWHQFRRLAEHRGWDVVVAGDADGQDDSKGSPGDYDVAAQTAIKTVLANAAEVTTSAVSLTLTAGSVIVTADIFFLILFLSPRI